MIPKIGQRYKNNDENILVEVVEIDYSIRFLVLWTVGSAFKAGEKFASGSLRPNGNSTGEWLYLEGQDRPQ